MFFFFNDTATTEIYTLSLHDALPIYRTSPTDRPCPDPGQPGALGAARPQPEHLRAVLDASERSEEHTSELQSRQYLVCRLLLEKKKKKPTCLTDEHNCTRLREAQNHD